MPVSESDFAATLLDKLKLEDPWLPPSSWESIKSESGPRVARPAPSSDHRPLRRASSVSVSPSLLDSRVFFFWFFCLVVVVNFALHEVFLGRIGNVQCFIGNVVVNCNREEVCNTMLLLVMKKKKKNQLIFCL